MGNTYKRRDHKKQFDKYKNKMMTPGETKLHAKRRRLTVQTKGRI